MAFQQFFTEIGLETSLIIIIVVIIGFLGETRIIRILILIILIHAGTRLVSHSFNLN